VSPKSAYDTLSNRMRKARLLNDELAEYFKERAVIEENYAKSLQRLNTRFILSDRSALGHAPYF
jgi:hypothetical protein